MVVRQLTISHQALNSPVSGSAMASGTPSATGRMPKTASMVESAGSPLPPGDGRTRPEVAMPRSRVSTSISRALKKK